jgi:protein-S-isoprenylcysteine O-methyltransferase Ste14
VAFGAYVAFLVVAFAVRPALRRRRTGHSGWRPPSSPVDAVAEALWALGLLATASGPLLAMASTGRTVEVSPLLAGLGLALLALGAGIALLAQAELGEAWKPSADDGGHRLFTGGMFAWVRHPFYLGCMLASLGVAAAVPNAVTAAGAVAVVVAAHLVVRFVEEPGLGAAHGPAYQEYARRTGRFLPRLSRR